MDTNEALRDHLRYLLSGAGAHLDFDAAMGSLPRKLSGAKPKGLPHTPWRLPEHMRIAQWDILEFSRNPKHQSHLAQRLLAGGRCPVQRRSMDRQRGGIRLGSPIND